MTPSGRELVGRIDDDASFAVILYRAYVWVVCIAQVLGRHYLLVYISPLCKL